MRRVAIWLMFLLSCTLAVPIRAQSPALPPHSWLFGAWIGGLYPPPATVGAAECLSQPSVIFTRDVVMRATFTDLSYTQREIDTARATANGAEFRFLAPVKPAAEGGPLFGTPGAAPVVGFGCETADVLHVVRQSEDQITFPHCSDFPYPLIRCPAR
jgi:hypothetical protein